MTAPRRLVRVLQVAVCAWIVLEVAVGIGLAVAEQQLWIDEKTLLIDDVSDRHREILARALRSEGYLALHSGRGWTARPETELPEHGITIGSDGLRGTARLVDVLPPGITRVLAFGDSYTFGSEVRDEQAWVTLLDAEPDLQVLNFGVSAYGPDQALLRYRDDGRWHHADVVLLGVMPSNIARTVNVFRPFYSPRSGVPFAKPRFRLAPGGLQLLPNPLPSTSDYEQLLADPEPRLAALGTNDHFFATRPRRSARWTLPTLDAWRLLHQAAVEDRLEQTCADGPESGTTYATEGEPYAVFRAVIDTFCREVAADGARPVVLLLPRRGDLEQIDSHGHAVYDPLVADLRAAGWTVLDLAAAFAIGGAHPTDGLFAPGRHYAAAGNARIAEWLRTQRARWLSGE